jgi:hypothetical protein
MWKEMLVVFLKVNSSGGTEGNYRNHNEEILCPVQNSKPAHPKEKPEDLTPKSDTRL